MSGKVNSVWSVFAPREAAGRREYFCAAEAEPGAFPDFRSEFDALWERYLAECAARGIGTDDELLLRFHLSDAANQGPLLRQLLAGRPASVVDQPPAAGSRVALEAWFVARGGERHVRISYSPRVAEGDSRRQMYELFSHLTGEAGTSGFADRVLRTWIYCRDVDNNYPGVVSGRNRAFDELGLTERYLASTGIGGGSDDPRQLVAMDALVCSGNPPEQTPLRALEHLSPTVLYGVRFERAMRAAWRDRDWLIVSGTASIDRHGKVLYPGDIRRQSRRVVENISALLAEGGADLGDVRAATVYLRDPADLAAVRAEFAAAFPGPGMISHPSHSSRRSSCCRDVRSSLRRQAPRRRA